MAEILRGHQRGKQARLQQFCNGWVVVDVDGGESQVLNVTSVRLDPEEVAIVMDARDAGQTGYMFKRYALNESTGMFRALRPDK